MERGFYGGCAHAAGAAPRPGEEVVRLAELSDIQRRIYNFIVDYSHREGRPPTNREIGAALSIQSTGHVDYHLGRLQKLGMIEREPRTSRGIRLRSRVRGLVVRGTIAAGSPLDIFAPPDQETLDLTVHSNGYVLHVRGNSMIDDHINDGDYVLIDPQAYVGDGDIIVATHKSAEGEAGAATLKRIYKEANRVRLQPANSTMEPIFVGKGEWDREWEVQGKVTAMYRRC